MSLDALGSVRLAGSAVDHEEIEVGARRELAPAELP
jgi:hypothetical protein